MTYRAALDFLYAQLPMYHRIGPAAFKKDLTNTLALCAHLGNPQEKFPSIHVGGTNGKGSVSHMLAAVLQAAGKRVGLYTSPHYKDFRERIKIDGDYMSRRRVAEFIERHREKIQEIEPSFFELTVALAFDHFAREKVDIAVIEVGLGGRLDSTNIITPLLSVITNISYDHQSMLGDTLAQIAGEKAGIIKPHIPVVIGETHPESAPVFLAKAAETGSPIVFADQHFEVEEKAEKGWEATVYQVFKDKKPLYDELEVNAAGPYQAKNIATVLQAIDMLPQLSIPAGAIYALAELRKRTRFMGRWQVIGRRPTVLCDSAHNEAGIRVAFERILALVAEVEEPGSPAQQKGETGASLYIVTGFVNDKDVDKVLGLFPSQARYFFAKANIPRGLDAEVLREKAATVGLKGKAYTSVKRALAAAKRSAGPDDLIVVIGSIFVVAEVL